MGTKSELNDLLASCAPLDCNETEEDIPVSFKVLAFAKTLHTFRKKYDNDDFGCLYSRKCKILYTVRKAYGTHKLEALNLIAKSNDKMVDENLLYRLLKYNNISDIIKDLVENNLYKASITHKQMLKVNNGNQKVQLKQLFSEAEAFEQPDETHKMQYLADLRYFIKVEYQPDAFFDDPAQNYSTARSSIQLVSQSKQNNELTLDICYNLIKTKYLQQRNPSSSGLGKIKQSQSTSSLRLTDSSKTITLEDSCCRHRQNVEFLKGITFEMVNRNGDYASKASNIASLLARSINLVEMCLGQEPSAFMNANDEVRRQQEHINP